MQVLSGWSFTQPTTHNPLFPFFSILIMRWSLILSALIAVQSTISSVCVALPIPPQSEELERRSPAGVKLSSKQYRENSVKHPDAYHFTGLGPNGKLTSHATVTKEKLPSGTNYQHAQTLKNSPKENHADHVFEVQMFQKHLQNHNIPWKSIDPKLQNKVKTIINGHENMAMIPGSINSSKGQMIKNGMKGKEIKHNPARDAYAQLSYDTAHKTAARLDNVLKEHPGYSDKVGRNTLTRKLHDTFVSAGLRPGSTPSSRSSSQSSSRSSSVSQGRSNSRQSSPSPGPGPSRQSNSRPSSPDRGRTSTVPNKRQATTVNSPPRTRQRTGKK